MQPDGQMVTLILLLFYSCSQCCGFICIHSLTLLLYCYLVMLNIYYRDFSDSRWLEAHCDRNLHISVLPRSILSVDALSEDDYQLIFTDFNQKRLRIYKRILTTDIILNDVPNSLIAFFNSFLEPRVPAVAVACGPNLFIYKNGKPFFKFHIPSASVSPLELEFWEKLRCDSLSFDIERYIKQLTMIHSSELSARSQELLLTTSPENVIQKYKFKRLTKESSITCMSTLKKSSYDKYELSCPILATESGNVYILDPQTLAILQQAITCNKMSTPFILNSTGLFDVDYKIIIACREGHICILMRGWLEGKLIIEFVHDIVDMVFIPGDNFIFVATNQRTLACFTKRGQNLWSTKISNPVTCVCLLSIHNLNINLVAVGLVGGIIQFYSGRYVVDRITISESPSAITFGQLGQEENVLVIITSEGTVIYKILKRIADFKVAFKENISLLQYKSIPLPKRSKLFLEQNLRERSGARGMHTYFQQDLIKLRIKNATELANYNEKVEQLDELQIEAKITGLGYRVSIELVLRNMDSKKCFKELIVICHSTSSDCSFSSYVVKIPYLPPSCSYKLEIPLKELSNKNYQNADTILQIPASRIYVKQYKNVKPDFAVKINVP